MKIREDIEALKRNWKSDPIWDIEDTEGFEDHREELLQFSKEMQAIWDKREQEMAWRQHVHGPASGLTKREHFAGLAMQGLCAADVNNCNDANMVATWAVEQANALLAALEQTNEE